MKWLFILCMISFATQSFSQSDADMLARLDKAGLITSYEKKEFLKEASARSARAGKIDPELEQFHREEQIELRKEPHFILNLLAHCKMYTTSGTYSIFFSPAPVEIPRGQEKTFIQRHEIFINKIAAAGLISKTVFASGLEAIRKLDLRSPYEIAVYLSNMTEQEYFLKWDNYGKFLDTLVKKKIISAANYDIVKKKLIANEFRNYSEPLTYLENLAIIDEGKYKDDPNEYMEPIYRITAGSFKSLQFDSIRFKTILDQEFDNVKFYNMVVQIFKENNQYVYSSFFDIESKPPNLNKSQPKLSPIRLPEKHYHVFNKMLADQGSPYRLHEMSLGDNKLGIIALTRDQFQNLMWSYSGQSSGYINLSYENFNSKVTLQSINKAVKLFDSLGLFSHLSAGDKAASLKKMESSSIDHFSDILSSFKDVTLEIDLEYGIDRKQYADLTRKLATISKGGFTPTDIVDTYDFDKNKTFQFGFTLNGKKYTTELKQEDDWLDLEFFDLITKALEEQNANGAFYLLYPNDGFRYIFLTNEQVDILNQSKLLELSEEDIN